MYCEYSQYPVFPVAAAVDVTSLVLGTTNLTEMVTQRWWEFVDFVTTGEKLIQIVIEELSVWEAFTYFKSDCRKINDISTM